MYSPVIDRSEADFEVIVFIALVERQHGAPPRARRRFWRRCAKTAHENVLEIGDRVELSCPETAVVLTN